MISTDVRARPNTIVCRPARMNGSAQRWASVSGEPRAPVRPSITGGSTSRMWRSPAGAPLRSTTIGRPARQRGSELARVADRGRAADDDRVRAVVAAQPEQPPQDVGDVAAEHAAVRVQLVDDDDPQLLEELEPLGVVGQDRRVEHVRVRDDDLPGGPDRRPDRRGRVAVVRRRSDGQRRGRCERRRTRRPGPGRAPWWGRAAAPGQRDPRRRPGGSGSSSRASCRTRSA